VSRSAAAATPVKTDHKLGLGYPYVTGERDGSI